MKALSISKWTGFCGITDS